MTRLGAFVVGAWLAVSVAGNADATSIIRFDNPTVDGGTLAYDGLGGPLVGTDIIFQNIIGTDTPLNSGVLLDCLGCLLNFTTGANTQEGGLVYTWDGGGSFVLTGTAQETGGGAVIASGVLLQGIFADPALGLAGPEQFLFVGTGSDEKNAELLAFYGLTGFTFDFANTDIAADYTQAINGSLAGIVTESDVVNTGRIPWAGSLLLMGVGAALLATRRI